MKSIRPNKGSTLPEGSQVQDLRQHSCEKEIQEAQLKATPARIAMLKLFESHEKPMDAQHVVDHLVKTLGIDRVTVFRILNAFVAKRLIRKLEFREGKARYELANTDHHHLICSSCGTISDISEDSVMHDYIGRMEKKYGFDVSEHILELMGTCSNCQKKIKN